MKLVLMDDEDKQVEFWEIDWYYHKTKDLAVLVDEISDRLEGLTDAKAA